MQAKLFVVTAALIAATLGVTACSNAATAPKDDMMKPPSATSTMGAETKAKDNVMMKAVYHKITQDEAKERMDKNPKVIIVDVRTPAEYKDATSRTPSTFPWTRLTKCISPRRCRIRTPRSWCTATAAAAANWLLIN